MSGEGEIKQGASHGRERASPSRIEERDNQDHDHAGEGAAAKAPTSATTMLTIQPSTPRPFVHASWMPTASAAAKTTSAMAIGPPTLDCGTAPLD